MVAGPLECARAVADARLGPDVACSEELSRWSLLLSAHNLFVMSSAWEGLMERCSYSDHPLAGFRLNTSAQSLEVLPKPLGTWAEQPAAIAWSVK